MPPIETARRAGSMTIREVTDRTGVPAATLRAWELRYGFPRPERLPSGHRRYSLGDVEAILEVNRRRNGGVRLDVAIGQAALVAMAGAAPESPSVYAELRLRHPRLPTHRLRKATLLALSWAIEDEFCARAEKSYLFGCFQQESYFQAARPRWNEFARVARAAFVFADFEEVGVVDQLVCVPTDAGSPLRREWLIVCDAPHLAVALSAWEPPGQDYLAEEDRVFEGTWTLDPVAVRDAARVCAQVAAAAGAPEAMPALYALAEQPAATAIDPVAATDMFNRVVAYMDRFAVDRSGRRGIE